MMTSRTLACGIAYLCMLLPAMAGAACLRDEPGSLWNYEGMLGGKFRVRMSLVFAGPRVEGVYFYASQLQDIRLRGRIEGGTRIVLDELDAAGAVTARFEATFPPRDPGTRYGDSPLECEVIAGTWRRLDGANPLAVYLAAESSTSGSLGQRYAILGVQDDEVVNRGAQDFWRAVKAGDRRAVAARVAYPITVQVGGKRRRLGGPGALLEVYDAVFTPAFRRSIEAAMPRNMFVRDQGVMLGSGQAWFDARGRVVALNN